MLRFVLDVVLLSYVFEQFRKLCLNKYWLDAYSRITLRLTLDALLKQTIVGFEVITHHEIYVVTENLISCGILQCVNDIFRQMTNTMKNII